MSNAVNKISYVISHKSPTHYILWITLDNSTVMLLFPFLSSTINWSRKSDSNAICAATWLNEQISASNIATSKFHTNASLATTKQWQQHVAKHQRSTILSVGRVLIIGCNASHFCSQIFNVILIAKAPKLHHVCLNIISTWIFDYWKYLNMSCFSTGECATWNQKHIDRFVYINLSQRQAIHPYTKLTFLI